MSTLIPSQFPNYPNNLSALNTYLHPFWDSLDTATIRSLIYRAIGGCGGFENLQKYPNYTVDILRRGELLPTIMPTSPFLAKKVLHKKGFCLTCHSALRFPDGDRMPLKEYCAECIEIANPVPLVPFWHTIDLWPAKYQEECINYLLRNRVFLIPDGEVYPIAVEDSVSGIESMGGGV